MPAGRAADASDEGQRQSKRPFIRVYVGTKSEGTRVVKWREASAPLGGLLVSRLWSFEMLSVHAGIFFRCAVRGREGGGGGGC